VNISLARPLPAGVGRVSQWWGLHPDWYRRFGLPGHNGLDYAAPLGTPVLAAHDGDCVVGDDPQGFGCFVRVNGDGYYTLYAHLSAVTVETGEAVGVGQQLGNVGTTGNSTGPHLHFGLRVCGEHRDYSGYNGWLNPTPFRDA